MPIVYHDFDTTQANLVTELVTRINAHPDWTTITPTPLSTNTTASINSSGTTLTVGSTAGFFSGQRIKVTSGANTYYRLVAAVTSETTMIISSSFGSTVGVGASVAAEFTLVKATTTRGADMIIDLTAGDQATELYRMSLRFWETMPAEYASTNPMDMVDRYLYFRASGGVSTQAVHVIMSLSKEHFYLSVEGPRAHEAGAFSTTYGSLKNYAFISDVVPYHAGDTVPCVVASSGTIATASASVNGQAHLADLSRDYANTESWSACRLASLTFPTVQTIDTVAMERDCTIDGNKYLFPYVVFSDQEGIRGRLSRFFYAGGTQPTSYADSPAPVGEKVTFDGIVYKLLAVNKSDGASDAWGAFGAADNGNSSAGRSVVVAVPMMEAP